MADDDTNGPTDRALRELLDAERHRTHVEARRRQHDLRRQADESVALVDVLGVLADHGAVVSLRTVHGTLPAATICDVGRDYVALRAAGPTLRLVPVAAIASVRPISTGTDPPRRSPSEPRMDLSERLRELAGHWAVIRASAGCGAVTGRLLRVGRDVLVVEEDGADAFVALANLTEVVVDP